MRYCGPPASRFRPPPAISAYRAGGPQPFSLSAARQSLPPSACNLGSSSRRTAAFQPFRRPPVVAALRLQSWLIEPAGRSLSVFPPPASRFRPPPAISAHRAGGPQPLCLSAARQLFSPSACNLGSSSRRAVASLSFRRLPVVSARLQFRLIEPAGRSLGQRRPAAPQRRLRPPQAATRLPSPADAVGGKPPCAAQGRDYRRSEPNIRDRAPQCIDVCNRLMPV